MVVRMVSKNARGTNYMTRADYSALSSDAQAPRTARLEQRIVPTPNACVHVMGEGSKRFPITYVQIQQDRLSNFVLPAFLSTICCSGLK